MSNTLDQNAIKRIEQRIKDRDLQKWIESMPNCNYELTSFKHGEYRGEKQLKLFLSKKD